MQLQLSTATDETEAKRKEVEAFQQKAVQQDEHITALEVRVQKWRTQVETLQQELQSWSDTAVVKNEQILHKQEQLLSLKVEMANMQVKLAEAESEKQHVLWQEKAAQKEKETLQQYIAQLKMSIVSMFIASWW